MDESRLNEIVNRLIEILFNEQNINVELLNLNNFSYEEKREVLRILSIKRKPEPLSTEFMKLQNELLKFEAKQRGIFKVENLNFDRNMAIYFGDIRKIDSDAIVDAVRPMTVGSFDPHDKSTDSVIISAGGLQIRQELNHLLQRQTCNEERGMAKITKAYNLPSKFIIHTIGPEIKNKIVSYKDKVQLSQCYKSSLDLAVEKNLKSITFCAISTGTNNFPKELAAKIAVSTVVDWLKIHGEVIKVIFCVFDEKTKALYEENLKNY